MGPYRSGKSFLLNRFNGKQKGFEIGETTNPCTEGVWVWGTSDVSDSKDHMTLLIDTEGLFAYNRDENTDMTLFLFTSLISSIMIYNSFGVIDESVLERFHFLTRLGEYFGFLENKGKLNERDISKYFPQFIWLLRDFSLDLTDEEMG